MNKLKPTPNNILSLLKQGYVRYTKDETIVNIDGVEKKDGKSIQTYWGVSATNVKKWFQHEKLKNKKTIEIIPLCEDEEDISTLDTNMEEENVFTDNYTKEIL